ncbi:hypothetical protein GGX14DRAFT_563141 [Mycena pura]|uniref:Uncharacterized protein n=1 Tax=Mycena pura TaxID=153505 RepID=A0AAD6VIS4_9AGAR|nr:hypothetical protein GGX14DRAFT_563141 [Mycena pura]
MKDRIIKHAIMFGRGEFHAGVIVMPADEDAVDPSDMEVADLRGRIWPTVEEANRLSPTHSRIFKEAGSSLPMRRLAPANIFEMQMILIANPSKPFEMTAKATPRRQAVLDAYCTISITNAYVYIRIRFYNPTDALARSAQKTCLHLTFYRFTSG